MAENEEEKGFVVKDRRRFTEEAEGEQEKQEQRGSGEPASGEPPGGGAESAFEQEEHEQGPFPEVTLATFIFSLSSSALVHLGEIPEPETNRTLVDLTIAKQIIDTLGMLQEKTKGNLDHDEENLLRSVLYDLRMRYVQKSGK
ncbi:MAG: DUF1844 domain-containing protein [Syntrophobacteraceae bacterium]|nr:DUF1844 domain-containing protein [Syntrophobacteraceae bacterium]